MTISDALKEFRDDADDNGFNLENYEDDEDLLILAITLLKGYFGEKKLEEEEDNLNKDEDDLDWDEPEEYIEQIPF